jgi:hypothetical protein
LHPDPRWRGFVTVELAMTKYLGWIPLSLAFLASPLLAQTDEVRVKGRVTAVHGPRLFTVVPTETAAEEVLVLTPHALSTPVTGVTVAVRGAIRRFDEAELKGTAGWDEIDQTVRKTLAGQPVLVATSLIATMPDVTMPNEDRSPAPAVRGVARGRNPTIDPAVLTLRPATLVAIIEDIAGRRVRILNARVVGVLEPHAFLVEPAVRYDSTVGFRDRILVLIDSASLRVPASLLVSSNVTIAGVARTVVGLQVTGEMPWPAKLDPETIDRLEVRAAILARSVQTPDGTELTSREPPSERPR